MEDEWRPYLAKPHVLVTIQRVNNARTFVSPPKLIPGSRVAIVSPSWAGPGVFPEVHEIGLQVLRDEFSLEPVEYPTTRQVGASPAARAADLMAAFSDPTIGAVMASIGGSDQITVLPFLDPAVIASNPKAYFGYSDNTNLLNYLWNLGVSSYHGGSTLVHLARPGGPHPIFIESLRRALFNNETIDIAPTISHTDLQCDWADLSTLESSLPTTPEPGWKWHNSGHVVTGRTWGGNLEILYWNLAANRWILPNEEYEGCVFLVETSEEMPSSTEVFRMLRGFGERGLLAQFSAMVWAKPKAWHPTKPLDAAERLTFRQEQEQAVLDALAIYNPDTLFVFGPDFGHTDPQYVLPYGGTMVVDGTAERISVTY